MDTIFDASEPVTRSSQFQANSTPDFHVAIRFSPATSTSFVLFPLSQRMSAVAYCSRICFLHHYRVAAILFDTQSQLSGRIHRDDRSVSLLGNKVFAVEWRRLRVAMET
jgi:hypothetical protein